MITIDPRQLRLPCKHHWLVASPSPEHAGRCPAVCTSCGSLRVFKVWLEDSWGKTGDKKIDSRP